MATEQTKDQTDNRTVNPADNPGVVAPPPLIYLGAVVIGGVFNYFFPMSTGWPRLLSLALGTLLIALAGGTVSAAFREFRLAGTNVDPRKPTTAIVTGGIYRFSRNPIYLSLTILYLGAALLIDSLWILLLLAPVLVLVNFGVIQREEIYLENRFGDEYARYKSKVRRWL